MCEKSDPRNCDPFSFRPRRNGLIISFQTYVLNIKKVSRNFQSKESY